MGAEIQEIRIKSKSISTMESVFLGWSTVSSSQAFNKIFALGGHHPISGGVTSPTVLPPAADSEMLRTALDEIREYLRRIEALETQVAEMRAELGWDQPEPRGITNTQAKREIRAYFREHDGKDVYPDEIAEALNLDLMQVVSVCDELENAGKIISKA